MGGRAMAKRKTELTVASVIFMLLVIFIHVAAECVGGYDRSSVQFAVVSSLHRLSSFVVQGFIFISGVKLFLSFREDFSLGRFYLSRICRVVIPYVIAFSLFYAYLAIRGGITPSAKYYFTELLTGGLVGHLYFVAIICQFYLLMPLWRLLYRRGSAILWLTVSLMLMLICKAYLPEIVKVIFGYELRLNSRLFTSYLFYFVAGIFAAKYYDRFTEFLRGRRVQIISLSAISGAVNCLLIYVIYRGRYYPAWAENFHVLYCILAILCTLSIALKYAECKLASSYPMKLTERASYNVYLIHPLFIFLVDSACSFLGVYSLTLRLVIRFGFTYIVSIGICVLYEWVKDRVKKR